MITENLDLFFADFGLSFTAGAVSGMCIKDEPGTEILGNQIIEVDYRVIVKSSQFGGLLYGNTVSVDGAPYVVKEALPVEDGVFSLIMLERLEAAIAAAKATLLADGLALVTSDGLMVVF